MKILLLQTGEPLHIDGGTPRPMRIMNLVDALIDRGHNVEVWSSAFYHQEKRHRTHKFETIRVHDRLSINLIPSIGYRRNIGLVRLIDHAQMAFFLWKILRSYRLETPAVAFVGYPPIEVAWVMLRWLKRQGVPSFIDVKDQWPSLFVEAVPSLLRPLASIILAPYFWLGRRAMLDATAITSMSEPFLNWALQFAGRRRQQSDTCIPLVPARTPLSGLQLDEARQWWTSLGIDLINRRCFSFVGSLSQAFDFSALRGAVSRLHQIHPDCQFVICGSGPEECSVKSLFADLSYVFFPGWIDAPKIAALMDSTVATLAPYRNTNDFLLSLPNKVLDSFAFGLPIITGLRGEVEKLINDNGVGIICPDTENGWLGALLRLLEDDEYRRRMSLQSAKLFADKYDANKVYGSFSAQMEKLVMEPHGR